MKFLKVNMTTGLSEIVSKVIYVSTSLTVLNVFCSTFIIFIPSTKMNLFCRFYVSNSFGNYFSLSS